MSRIPADCHPPTWSLVLWPAFQASASVIHLSTQARILVRRSLGQVEQVVTDGGGGVK
jgi:hypothetical protein